VFLADSSVVALHSLRSGRKTIGLPGPYRMTDLVSERPAADGTSEFTFDLVEPKARAFLLQT
jgi:hypothetical protein